MEPVPETERMEEFRSSPIPSLRLQSVSSSSLAPPDPNGLRKPPNMRRSTDPSPTSLNSPLWSHGQLPFRTRTASPLSYGHSRSRSAASSLAPPMARTQSLPGVNGAGHILYSPQLRSSPSVSPSRARAPRKPADEAFPPSSPTRTSIFHPERKLSERSSAPNLGLGMSSSIHNPRIRRPQSPLHTLGHVPASLPDVPETVPETVQESEEENNEQEAGQDTAYEVPTSVASSPSYRSYDPLGSDYGRGYSYATTMYSSSVPSTPTSVRSRSPSISSLETIEDSPDAEEAALEAERIAQLKAAADAADGGGDSKGRGGLDTPVRGRTLSFGPRDKRKRWSVCGAERRGDLNLDTIWED
ncbi:hypothetical protein DL546_007065 [Coniochaeta pulveracea]|uniref:Basic proline-rich protein n=1 Tax=Coniochaeta pulveracea TaxID=177199 RepID=A0A420Y7G2_9PEZI|nr:hypothetical protein DL546_007065 [Coniochaeta pulveracea]